jgi:hypothetical protein
LSPITTSQGLGVVDLHKYETIVYFSAIIGKSGYAPRSSGNKILNLKLFNRDERDERDSIPILW